MFLGVSIAEWVGYLASAFLMVAFTMKNVNKLRIINSLGCITFVIYGFMLDIAWPIIISNAFILGSNLYYLFFKKDSEA
ncbi:inner membrane protein [Pustulibacterium marinum]|uniref:Inner membrane protein n=1 Tax=Pustulibacterium marinum TaxID=1224947 RepID=A0A1I7HUV8_9FLAO|nr:YgjV family protein [Pustulibacterium marinum]SFU64522.1 inner membrane protein [Pustulibacterium marinum]